jgi:hypothetical protein
MNSLDGAWPHARQSLPAVHKESARQSPNVFSAKGRESSSSTEN